VWPGGHWCSRHRALAQFDACYPLLGEGAPRNLADLVNRRVGSPPAQLLGESAAQAFGAGGANQRATSGRPILARAND
jgi:hypothetical protein